MKWEQTVIPTNLIDQKQTHTFHLLLYGRIRIFKVQALEQVVPDPKLFGEWPVNCLINTKAVVMAA